MRDIAKMRTSELFELFTLAADKMKLSPEASARVLRDDYRHMQNMIFGDKPPFDKILAAMQVLEDEIHAV